LIYNQSKPGLLASEFKISVETFEEKNISLSLLLLLKRKTRLIEFQGNNRTLEKKRERGESVKKSVSVGFIKREKKSVCVRVCMYVCVFACVCVFEKEIKYIIPDVLAAPVPSQCEKSPIEIKQKKER